MLNRIFVREQWDEDYCVVNNRLKIGVIGMGSAVGTSFIGTSIAKELTREKEKHIAYVEVNCNKEKAFLYDSLGMDKRFAGRTFYDFHTEISKGRSIAGLINLDERINWALCLPENIKESQKITLEPIELCRLINNIAGDCIICDITQNEGLEDILKEMDLIIFVIDPLPSKLIKGYDILCHIKRCQYLGQKVVWVVNKYNTGINRREFYDFIKIKNFIKVPIIPQEDIYSAEYNCKLAYSLKAVNEALHETIRQIIHLFNT